MVPNKRPLLQQLAAEALGSALLLCAIVGSGIMGERLSGRNLAVALLANSLATGAMLVVLILTFDAISGAHFNPLVTLSTAWKRLMPWSHVIPYVLSQISGAFVGILLTHAMFDERLLMISHHVRSGNGELLSEFLATFGLLTVIGGNAGHSRRVLAFSVGAYMMGAYWFTSSTSFANPVVTLARSMTDTFTGIRPADVPGFIAAQVMGAIAAILFLHWLSSPGENDSLGNTS